MLPFPTVEVHKYDALNPFFPSPDVCQHWKLDWLGDKLVHSAEKAVVVLDMLTKNGPIHVDKNPLMHIYGETLRFRQDLFSLNPDGIPRDFPNKLDVIINDINKYFHRLNSSPYFSELPFSVKDRIADPVVDCRIAALNLKRSMGPCLEPPVKTVVPLAVADLSRIGMKFL